jgi:hypothetical protein
MIENQPERKSDLRLALEGACYRRAAIAKDGSRSYGVDLWQFENKRWGGEAWFRDAQGIVVRVTWQGCTPTELGQRLIDSIELIPLPTERTQK